MLRVRRRAAGKTCSPSPADKLAGVNRRRFLQGTPIAACCFSAGRAVPYSTELRPEDEQGLRDRWVQLAESLKPALRSSIRKPVAVVRPVADGSAFLRWKMEPAGDITTWRERLFRPGDAIFLDFGDHGTGYVSFQVSAVGTGVDAPARIQLTFGEMPVEVAEPHDPYSGQLSRAWLQDEAVTVDVLPAQVQLQRRFAFRYIKLEVLAASHNYAVRFDDIQATALTSAAGVPAALPVEALTGGTSELLRRIDAVSINTLRDCMQTVFEDGPKRDRRLWIGDLRLQALTNYATFRNYDLVKRCLYLFAGLPREDGALAACVFEQPKPVKAGDYIVDYAALYGAVVLDYAKASKDWATARELWPVVRRQMQLLGANAASNGLFAAPKGQWVFIDWRDQLDHEAAMHGVFVYALKQALELARAAGASDEAAQYSKRIAAMSEAGHAAYFDRARRVFVSGPQRQVSWAAQAWMVLSGIATREEGAAALLAVREMNDAVRPGSPYLYHHVAEAMLQCGLKREALDLIEWYWGGMVKAGADTFWEVYDPAQPGLSPYGSILMNSYCHAWSCTPAYLLRRIAAS